MDRSDGEMTGFPFIGLLDAGFLFMIAACAYIILRRDHAGSPLVIRVVIAGLMVCSAVAGVDSLAHPRMIYFTAVIWRTGMDGMLAVLSAARVYNPGLKLVFPRLH